jgi:hypothetical protein
MRQGCAAPSSQARRRTLLPVPDARKAAPTSRGGPPLRRLAVLVAAAAALVGGCGGAASFPDEPTTTFSPRVPDPGAATTVPAPPRSAPASGAATASTVPAASTARTAPGTSRPPTTRPTAPAVNAGDQAILAAASGPPGGAAGVILQRAPATSLVVEALEEPGAPANRVALSRVLSDLRTFSGKPVSEVHTALPAGSSSRRWTERDLAVLAERSTKVPQGSGRFVLRLLSVRGQNVRSPNILAESFRGDTIATFPDSYASSGQHIVTTVTVHEVGHLLGLVDLYLNRGRADTQNDPAGEGHSRNPGSVMYFAVDPSVIGALFGSASDRFDAQDLRDIAAIRAGAPKGSNPP